MLKKTLPYGSRMFRKPAPQGSVCLPDVPFECVFHGGYAYTPGFISVHDCMRFINTGMFILHTDNCIL